MSDDWERVGRRLLVGQLGDRRERVTDAVYSVEETLRDGDAVRPDDVRAMRRHIEQLQRVVEETVAPVATADDDGTGTGTDADSADGVEPWGRRPKVVPYGNLAEWASRDGPE